MRSPIVSLSRVFATRRRRVRVLAALLVAGGVVAAAVLALPATPDGAAAPARTPRTPEPSVPAGPPTATPAAGVPADPSDRILAGARLRGSETISTATGSHRLVMQASGDLVLFAGTTAVWNTATAGSPGAELSLGTDGAMTVDAADGTALWSNDVHSAGSRLVVKPDGRLYEIDPSGAAVWSTPPPSYLASAAPYVNPNAPGAVGARQARADGRVADAVLLDKAAANGSARWLSTADSVATVAGTVRTYAAAAAAAGQTPVFVTYAIPDRDCGSLSAGGYSADVYRAWSAAVAAGLQGTASVVIVEPDSLLQVYRCGNAAERFALLTQAGSDYTAAGAQVYLDAGTGATFGGSRKQLSDIAARLKAAGVEDVAGFATNVSNFQTTAEERTYGNRLSALLGGARYLIDTSRNGNGPQRDATGAVWCNPTGRALGDPPAATLDGPHVANLWIKTVGASDGACNGGPPAGQYWEAYLLGLVTNAHW